MSDYKRDVLVIHFVIQEIKKYGSLWEIKNKIEYYKGNLEKIPSNALENLENKFKQELYDTCVYFAKKSTLDFKEIVSLSLGIDPRLVSELIEKHDRLSAGDPALSSKPSYNKCIKELYGTEIYKKYSEIIELLQSHYPYQTQVLTTELVEWNKRMDIKLPEAFVESVNKYHNVPDIKMAYEELKIENKRQSEKLAKREETIDQLKIKEVTLNNLRKLVIAMAVRGYRYNPKASKNKSTKDISDDLSSVGLPLDEKTILRRLKESANLLPTEALEEFITK